MSAIDLRQIPKNASLSWPQRCGFWGDYYGGACPTRLRIGFRIGTSRFGPPDVACSVSGGWWTGSIGYACAGSDPRVSFGGLANCSCAKPNIYIDVWKALALGLWSSSVVFNLNADILDQTAWGCGTTTCTGPMTGMIMVAPDSTTPDPAEVDVTKSFGCNTAGGACPCGTTSVGSVTVYDDGSFTVA